MNQMNGMKERQIYVDALSESSRVTDKTEQNENIEVYLLATRSRSPTT